MLWGQSLVKVSTLTFCVVASIALGIIIDRLVEKSKKEGPYKDWYH